MKSNNLIETQISICIPTYNRFETLYRTLNEISLQETHEQFEIVISDNKSSDRTREIQSYFPQLNISYYSNDRNLGGNYNIIKVLSLASGSHLLLISDEDSVNLNNLIESVSEMIQTNTSLIITEILHSENKYYNFDKKILEPGIDSFREFGYRTAYISGLVFKKSDINFNFLFKELEKDNNGVLNTFPHSVLVNMLLLERKVLISDTVIVKTRESAEIDQERIDFVEHWQTPNSRLGQLHSDLIFINRFINGNSNNVSQLELFFWRYKVYLGTIFFLYYDSPDYDDYQLLNYKEIKKRNNNFYNRRQLKSKFTEK